jgi:L-asparaginase / beta-aspartyl-peptidase
MEGRILVHGGAGPWEEAGKIEDEAIRALKGAVETGLSAMRGGSAVDAVIEAVASLEGSGVFNAGKGAVLNLAGGMELDAGVMDGENLKAGAVAAVARVPHPVRLARVVMDRTRHILVSGSGAEILAEACGLSGELHPTSARKEEYEREKRAWLEHPDEWLFQGLGRGTPGGPAPDTVGAVAMDGEGRFAAATSTGGLPFKLPGRIGDSPLVGHGYYALRGAGAASTSGIGEAIARYGLSLRAVLRMGNGMMAQAAAEEQIASLTGLFGPETAGVILLDRTGSPGVFFNTGGMAIGYGGAGTEPGARIVMKGELGVFSRSLKSLS